MNRSADCSVSGSPRYGRDTNHQVAPTCRRAGSIIGQSKNRARRRPRALSLAAENNPGWCLRLQPNAGDPAPTHSSAREQPSGDRRSSSLFGETTVPAGRMDPWRGPIRYSTAVRAERQGLPHPNRGLRHRPRRRFLERCQYAGRHKSTGQSVLYGQRLYRRWASGNTSLPLGPSRGGADTRFARSRLSI